jgi:hypothetical protein
MDKNNNRQMPLQEVFEIASALSPCGFISDGLPTARWECTGADDGSQTAAAQLHDSDYMP